MPETFSLAIQGSLAELARLNSAVDAFLTGKKLSPDTVHAVEVAIEELAANTIAWGRDDQAAPRIEVHLTVEPSRIRVVIEDDGREFDPRAVPPPDLRVPLQRRREGGLGIPLVLAMVDQIGYRRAEGRNIMEMSIGL
ncbi:MAG: ATP-binding protein [Pirellulales bacterium]